MFGVYVAGGRLLRSWELKVTQNLPYQLNLIKLCLCLQM
jgi:hypothetical protein